jgi:hypothetical protein
MMARLRFLIFAQSSPNRLLQSLMILLFDFVIIVLALWNAFLANYMVSKLQMNDFGKFYYSAVAYLMGGDMYGPSPATWIKVTESYARPLWNMNPPHFHIPLLLLALMRPGSAIIFWGIGSLASLVVTWILIRKEIGLKIKTPWHWRIAILGALGFAGTGATFVTGQVTFLLLLLVTMCWLEARHERWSMAGLYIGMAISLKPFMLIFMPYLALRRQFRAVCVSTAVIMLCFGIGLLFFGLDAHMNWLRVVKSSSEWTWASMNASVFGLFTRALAESPYYSPLTIAPQLIRPFGVFAAGLICALTLIATNRNSHACSVDRDFALLLIGSQLISPLGWVYYLWLAFGPIAAVVGLWRRNKEQISADRGVGAIRWRNGLFGASMFALFLPLPVLRLFQPDPWASVLVGSSYFWGTFGLWSSLFLDWFVHFGIRDGFPNV